MRMVSPICKLDIPTVKSVPATVTSEQRAYQPITYHG